MASASSLYADTVKAGSVMKIPLGARVTVGAIATVAIMRVADGQEVMNGSFEEPVQATGISTLFVPGNQFKGWRVIGADGDVAVSSGDFHSGDVSFPAQDGNQWLDLTGGENKPAGVEQTVTTVPGTIYDLTFSVGNVSGNGWGVSSSVEVFVDGQSIGVATNSNGARLNRQVWQRFTMPFKASSATATIGFVNGDLKSDQINGLDSVSLAIHGPQAACTPQNADGKKPAKKKMSNPFVDLAALTGGVVTATDIVGKTSAAERQVASVANQAASASGDRDSAAGTPSECAPVK
jgi:Protein of unknown function (DUF642)